MHIMATILQRGGASTAHDNPTAMAGVDNLSYRFLSVRQWAPFKPWRAVAGKVAAAVAVQAAECTGTRCNSFVELAAVMLTP